MLFQGETHVFRDMTQVLTAVAVSLTSEQILIRMSLIRMGRVGYQRLATVTGESILLQVRIHKVRVISHFMTAVRIPVASEQFLFSYGVSDREVQAASSSLRWRAGALRFVLRPTCSAIYHII